MVTVIVNFPIPASLSLEDFRAQMMKSVPKYQSMPGLVRKTYIVDAKNRVGGGAYAFETRAHAEACFSADFIKGVTAVYGKPDIRYFDTLIEGDNQRSLVGSGAPARTIICHCTFCQRRTGSAFGFMPYFKQEAVKIAGALKSYEHRSDESHRALRIEFCPNCGTTVSMIPEVFAGMRGIAGGTFDDRSWIKIDRQVWTRSAHPWVSLPADIEKFPKASVAPPPAK